MLPPTMDLQVGTVGMSGAFGSRITLLVWRGAAHRSLEFRARAPAFRSLSSERKTLHSYHQCPSALRCRRREIKICQSHSKNIYQLTRFRTGARWDVSHD